MGSAWFRGGTGEATDVAGRDTYWARLDQATKSFPQRSVNRSDAGKSLACVRLGWHFSGIPLIAPRLADHRSSPPLWARSHSRKRQPSGPPRTTHAPAARIATA